MLSPRRQQRQPGLAPLAVFALTVVLALAFFTGYSSLH